jgi:hypothetical protein
MRLMRARMTRGTAVVMCVTSRSVRSAGFAPPPGGCIRQPDHRQEILMPGAGFAAPPGRWPTQNESSLLLVSSGVWISPNRAGSS